MKKAICILISIITVFSVFLPIQTKFFAAKAETERTNSFVSDVVEMINKNNAEIMSYEKNDIMVSESSEKAHSDDNDFRSCRLILQSNKPIDKLDSIAVASGYLNFFVLQFENEEDTKSAYRFYSECDYIETVSIDRVIDINEDFTVDDDKNVFYDEMPPKRLDFWGSEITGTYDVKDYIEENFPVAGLEEIVVAVIDTGVDYKHNFLKDRVKRTYFNSTGYGDPNNEYYSDNSHGTCVAGLIADNTPQNVKIASYKAIKQGTATISGVLAAIAKADSDGADIINMSFGASGLSESERKQFASVIQSAYSKNITLVASAGNDSLDVMAFNLFPAAIDEIITVGSTSCYNFPSQFSNSGRSIDLMAPGENVPLIAPNNKYRIANGTSFSAPLVASACAELKILFPNENNKQIEKRLKRTEDICDAIGIENMFGCGVIDIIGAAELERAEVPMINLDKAEYIGNEDIVFSFSEEYTVYYTIDQTYPSKDNGILYTGPFVTDEGEYTIKAVAYGDGLMRSKYFSQRCRFSIPGTDEMFSIDQNGIITDYNGSIKDLTIPEKINGITVTGFTEGLFADKELIGLNIPKTVTVLPQNLFYNNSNINIVDGSGVTDICDKAFYDCKFLYRVSFPNVINIGENVFYNTRAFSGIDFPECRYIGKYAFSCSGIRYINLPKAEIICFRAFYRCVCIHDINIPNVREFRRESYWGNEWRGASSAFQESQLYCTIDIPNAEIIPYGVFYYAVTAYRIEFSNARIIETLPIRNFKYPLFNSITAVLPSTLESCELDEIPYYDVDEKVEYRYNYIIYGSKGTYAEQWANENGFEFIEITPETAVITDLPQEYYSYMRPLEADVVGFNRTYQWYGTDTKGYNGGIAIAGANERKFDPNEFKQYKYYYCVVTSKDKGYDPITIKTGICENKSYVDVGVSADYSELRNIVNSIPSDLSIYTDESVTELQNVLDSIDYNLDVTEQEKIAEYVTAVNNAVSGLKLKKASYDELSAAIEKIPSDLSIYTDESVTELQAVLDSIDYNLDVTEQEKIAGYVTAVENAVSSLKLKKASYDELSAAIEKIPSDMSIYTDESVAELQAVLDSIDYNLDVTEQEKIAGYVTAVNNAVSGLKLKKASYDELSVAIEKIPSDLSIYTDESVAELQNVLDSIDYNLDVTEQEKIAGYITAVERAVSGLKLKKASYDELSAAIGKIPSDLSIYTDESISNLNDVLNSINMELDTTEQDKVDEYVAKVYEAIDKLIIKPADYSKVQAALANVPVDLSIYSPKTVTVLENAINSVDYSLNITEQDKVDEYAEQITLATNNLKKECRFIRFFRMIAEFFNRIIEKIKLLFN